MDENRTNVILSAAKNLSSFTAFSTSLRPCLRTHLSIAGGRKTMAAYGMVVAQLLFDYDDRVWYLHTENWRPGKERVMRPAARRSGLLPVPVLRWSSVSPVMTALQHRKRESNQKVPGTFSPDRG